jgi:PPIC-type peptidyl-prolyl cis-trans isomerase-like protein
MKALPLAGILAIAVLGACSAPPPALTVGQIAYSENELLALSAERRDQLAALAALGLAIAEEVALEVLDPAVEVDRETAILTQAAIEDRVQEREISDAQLAAFYRSNPEWELTVRHILFFSERWRSVQHRARAKAKGEAALERLRAGEDFPRIAAELSEEPGAEGREGLLRPGREGSWVPEFWNAALALDAGEISPVTESQYGYHVLRLEDRQVVPFEEARPRVIREIVSMEESPDRARERWLGGFASRREALRRAAEMGVELPESERSRIDLEWQNTVTRWAASLGFTSGMSAEAVKTAAREALASTRQGATIARGEIEKHGSLLRAAFAVTGAPTL